MKYKSLCKRGATLALAATLAAGSFSGAATEVQAAQPSAEIGRAHV